jgi:type IV pilus assembly protein PilC
MTNFIYRAKDWNGKLVKGVLDFSSKEEVVQSIKQNGLIPLMIKKKDNGQFLELQKKFFGKITLKQITTLTRQLATMMKAGLPLTDALSLLKNQAEGNRLMVEILDYALQTVKGGHSLGDGLDKYRKIFGEAYVASIRAGEEGGVLEEILLKLADNLEREGDFKSKVKGAMIYPIIVIIGMVVVTFIMMIFVIPKLTSLYSDFGSKMPAMTLGLMNISNFMAKFWFILPLLAVGIYLGFKFGDQNPVFRLRRDSLLLKIPIAGELNKKTIISNTIRTLSMLLSAGISLVDALKIVADIADNEVYTEAFLRVSERVEKGFSIADSFEETGVFPIIVNQMVSTGEATGKLDEVLMKVSDYFSNEAEQSVKSLTSAIEPIIMIILGLGVGFLVVAVVLPIYNLTSQF